MSGRSAIAPLSARSVAISTLLGYHPPELPVRDLVRAGALFGIADRTVRVALTRMAADGDVVGDDGVYRLTERLVARQDRHEETRSPRATAWDGSWEMAVVTTTARPLPERVALRRSMTGLRLAELREGVWTRPDNLHRRVDGPVAEQCTFFTARHADPASLVAALWDLPAWAEEARRLCTALEHTDDLRAGFVLVAEALRHLQADPFLPAEFLPGTWPGTELRERYTRFRTSYARRLRDYLGAGTGPAALSRARRT